MKITLSDIVLSLYKPITITGQEYSATLTFLLWFYDKSLSSLIIELFFKAFRICRQYPCFWEKVELVW